MASAIDAEDYIDEMSAPRVDPIHPELAGLALKERRKKRTSSSRKDKANVTGLNTGGNADSQAVVDP